MSSSLNKPQSDSGQGTSSVLSYLWRGNKGAGPETVITNPRVMSLTGSSGDISASGNDVVPRLFPTGHDADHVAGITIGHFTIQKRIGVGGMGSVFLAMDDRLKRDVALKVLAPSLSLDQTSVQRFQNEAQAAARLDHDNIARVFYSGEEAGLHYIAYEYVPGQNLRDLIRSKKWLDPPEAVNYTIQLAAALHHLSGAGVIHRDIKPSNVLITPFGRAKLVDLGLARKTSLETSFELTIPGTTLGTFDYISPEQARDPHSVDVRSDIYSLGCTLYHMLTGEPPYPEGTVLQKLLDHQDKEPPDPARKNRRVTPMLSHVVRKMMASVPARRYSSPADLLRDLLIVARSLGAGAVPVDGQVWLTATRFKPPFWQSNFGWVATTCALCLLVVAVQYYPKLTQGTADPGLAATRRTAPAEPFIVEPLFPDRNVETDSGRAKEDFVVKVPDDPKRSLLDSTSFLDPKKQATSTIEPEVARVEPFPLTIGTIPQEPALPSERPSTPAAERPTMSERTTPERTPQERATADRTTSERIAETKASAEIVAPIRIVNGKSYDSLEAACTEAAEAGSIIELRYNGVRKPERPIRLPNKKLIIRGAVGYRPTITFAPTDLSADGSPHMVTVAGGLLEFVNVDLAMAVPNRVGMDRWALFSLERPERVQLKGVTVTVTNPFSKPACIFEQRAPVGQSIDGIGLRLGGMPVVPPETLITESFVRGGCDLIVMRDPVPARFELKDSVVGVDGNLLQLKLVSDMVGMERESISLELEHVTCLLGQSLLSVDGMGGLSEKLPPLFIDARNNVISCGPGRPLISMRGLSEFMDFQRSFSWKGDLNFYNSIETFLEISTSQLSGNSPAFDYAQWKSFWGSNEGVRSENMRVVKTPDKVYSSLTTDDVVLLADSNPAIKGASDGDAAGAPLKKLPYLDRTRDEDARR
ncbi:serine/threonine protein kinase [Schlesneria sp. DSM 10557]|uniref:serine/threonine protein kinase n=1 Tax=Schlesneria sp. DSM 10557 TaxID=3044399 RepID=UPI0035A01C86